MKRWSLVLAVAIVFFGVVLAACGGSNNGGGTASSGSGSSATGSGSQSSSSSGSASNGSAEEKVVLTMGSWRTEDVEAYEKIIAAFNQHHPNIEVQFKPTKNTEYNTVLNTELSTGGGPDIIHLRPYAAGQVLADAGYLVPLTDLPGIEKFSETTLRAATGSDGVVYGVPTVFSSTQIFYNKKIFADLNLQVPATWDELIATAETLKQNGIIPFSFGSKEGWLLSLTHGMLGPAVYGGSDFVQNVVTGQTNFQSEAFVASIQSQLDLVPYFPDNYVGLGMDDMRNLFVTEQAGMFVMGDWEIAVMKGMNPDLDMDAFPVPWPDGTQTVTTWVDGSFAVNANSPNKEAALTFLEFMTTEEFGTLVVNELKKPSTIPGVVADDPLVAKLSQFADTISTPYMFVVYFNSGNPTSKSVLENSLQAMFLGEMTPAQVAEEVQKSVDTWFKP
jgi:raffinose/stachyose/melibiose transport system substrate-binding protein